MVTENSFLQCLTKTATRPVNSLLCSYLKILSGYFLQKMHPENISLINLLAPSIELIYFWAKNIYCKWHFVEKIEEIFSIVTGLSLNVVINYMISLGETNLQVFIWPSLEMKKMFWKFWLPGNLNYREIWKNLFQEFPTSPCQQVFSWSSLPHPIFQLSLDMNYSTRHLILCGLHQ